VVVPVEPSRAGARAAVAAALAGGRGATGLVVANSAVVQEVVRALAARALVPGRDVPVVALCTDATAEAVEPPVTNVSLEPRDVSRRAMRILFALLDDEQDAPPSGVTLVQPRLTRRASTAPRS
ncbi:substrate-binding domain-containing protein, partial [Kineococcus glutinatus]|uniref:substrate-binding domain-containing protein n=1 Tax=Kineococcus glutinatus TaxID=1070872 RepID=UPI0031EAED2E